MRLSPQRALSSADHAKAARLFREMALLCRLQGAERPPAPPLASPPARRPADFSLVAKKDYADLIAMYGAPRLLASFVVKKLETLPAPVKAAFDSFRLMHGGAAEIALSTIDGHRTWQAQVTQIGSAQVLLLDAKGAELARGVARGAAVSWRPTVK